MNLVRKSRRTARNRLLAVSALSSALLSIPALADYELGVNAAFAGDYETAFREFSAAAEEGLDLAQYNLGILYFTGQGVDRNPELAYHWTLAAAEQGHTAAQYNLATLLITGDGVEKQTDKAIEWYSRAAKAGHPYAAFELAGLYDRGDEVERDRVTAHAWASFAVENEAEEAADLRASIERKLDEQELANARRLFARWKISR